MKLSAINEDSFLIILSDQIDLQLTDNIAYLCDAIETALGPSLLDITPSYTSILVQFNLLSVSPLVVEKQLETLMASCSKQVVKNTQGKLIELPVYYHPSVGWDLNSLSEQSGHSIKQIIELHQQQTYQVCAIGFAPGFAFLAEVAEPIQFPRHKTPRANVPAGSVAIADKQTAVYPSQSPGGWQIVGNCPVSLFDIKANPISPFSIGDQVKFNAVDKNTFLSLGGKVIEHE